MYKGQSGYSRPMGYNQQSSESLQPCLNCFKSFNPSTLAQHEKVCRPIQMSAKGTGKSSALGSYSTKEKNIFFQGGGGGYGASQEKTLSCAVCLARVPASQLSKHELECRQNSMQKKGASRVLGGGGALNRPTLSSNRVTKKAPEPEYQPPKMIQRPISLMCFICGREYGTKSLPIHIKSCQDKWETQQSNLSYKERRPMPRAPPGFTELLAKDNISRKDIDNYNNKAYDQYNYDVLVPCQNCGRTFKPESLIPHQKSCKSGNPLKPMSNAQKEYQSEQMHAMQNGNLNLVPCGKCGRKFASDRVNKHESVCKPGPTKQALRKQKALEQKKQKLDRNDRRYEQAAKTSKWRQQHDEFQQQLQYMRKVDAVEKKGGNIRSLPPPPSNSQKYGMKQCPHCLRTFSDDAASRHIGACKNTLNKPKPPPGVLAKQGAYQSKPSAKVSYGGSTIGGGGSSSISGGANKRAQSYNRPSYDNLGDDIEDNYGDYEKYTSPVSKYGSNNQKTYKITNSNYNSVSQSKGQFSSGKNDRDSWMKQMGTKQQKTHDNLYGIGAFSGNQVSNNAVFPAPKGLGGGFR